MKQTIAIVLLLSLTLTLAACGSEEEKAPVGLEAAGTVTEAQLNSHLAGIKREVIHNAWGEPNALLADLDGEIYLVPQSTRQIVIYYKEHIVDHILVIESVSDK